MKLLICVLVSMLTIITGCDNTSAKSEQNPSGVNKGQLTKDKKFKIFGAAPQVKGKEIALSQAIAQKNFNNQIRLTAEVRAVCQKAGCWMVLAENNLTVRITFKDYKFFVPKDIVGKKVIVEGVLAEKKVPEQLARHYAKDAGKSQQQVDKIIGDQQELSLVANSVLIPQ